MIKQRRFEKRNEETILQNAPRGDHGNNGSVEKAVQEMSGQVRTMKAALEDRIGSRIGPDWPICQWLVRHAGATLILHHRPDASQVWVQHWLPGMHSNPAWH